MWVLGGYRSDFARNLAREGVGIDGLVREVVEGTLAAAGGLGFVLGFLLAIGLAVSADTARSTFGLHLPL